jgi:hypothetical protein
MNRFLRKVISIAVPGLFLLGCDKYLEENPDNRVELNTVEKAAQLLTNAYSGAGYTFTEWMGNNVSYIGNTQKLPVHNQAFNWEEFTGDGQDTPSYFWTSTYDAIAHANEVLAVLDKLPGDQAKKDALEGEALLTRAYGHFMLVNLFAKHYDSKTASKDPGIPYATEPETVFIKKYERESVDDVYDKIEDDLLDGLKLVDGSYYANSGKYHFTKNAALAFASRFYLFKGDLDDCIKYSSELLGNDPEIFIKDIPALKIEKINNDDYVRLYNSPGDNSNLLQIRQVTNFHVPSLGYWPSNNQYSAIFRNNPFNLTDEREEPAYVAGSGSETNSGVAVAKFEFLFERTSITSDVGYNYIIFQAFRGEEVLLNRAECYALQNKLSSAVADLQLLVEKRYDGTPVLSLPMLRNYYGSSNNQVVLMEFILTERTKEFMHEGLKWFDIKRYEIPVEHTLSSGNTITLSANDKRKVIQIPQAAIDVGGLEPNPR